MRSVLRRLSEASTTFLMCSGRLLRPPASRSKPNLVAMTTLSRMGCERFPDEVFVRERAVDFGGIEERDAFFVGCANDLDALVPVCGRSVVGADAHAAGADFRDFQLSEFSCFHFAAPVVDSLRLIR